MNAIPPILRVALKRQLAAVPDNFQSVSGGDIHRAMSFEAGDKRYFLKYSSGAEAVRMLETEARGLSHLAKAIAKTKAEEESCQIPEPIATGQTENYAWLLLPYIPPGIRNEAFWTHFGRGLAGLHSIREEAYGFPFDNYIGRLPQSNRQHKHWHEFYAEERLLPQARMAFDASLLSRRDMQQIEQLIKELPRRLPEEAPSLTHGDLWSGNFLCDTEGRPWLIDPAPCYAHREMDIAMSKLFGGFAPRFYEAYAEALPLLPGYGERTKTYQLYYLLVHLNLFGKGYYKGVMEAVGRL